LSLIGKIRQLRESKAPKRAITTSTLLSKTKQVQIAPIEGKDIEDNFEELGSVLRQKRFQRHSIIQIRFERNILSQD